MNTYLPLRLMPLLLLSSCAPMAAQMGAQGPRMGQVMAANTRPLAQSHIRVVDLDANLDGALLQRLAQAGRPVPLSQALGDGAVLGSVLARGDVVDIAIWEAPPAALFGTQPGELRNLAGAAQTQGAAVASTARLAQIPEQMVDANGQLMVPFVGMLPAAGRTPTQLQADIARRLAGLANQPQVLVRLARGSSSLVTVVGEVNSATRLPLTPRAERLLDALASAGGLRQPIGKMTIQITRGATTAAMPMDTIIREPAQNIRLQAGDVVTALYQPFSFTALGASGTNAEIAFEGTGLSLAQALGRMGGLRDDRANPRGLFIFRMEEAGVLDGAGPGTTATGTPATGTPTGGTPIRRIPVIYRVNLADPANFFLAQSFAMRQGDVVYVSNAPAADLQKFVGLVSQLAITGLSVASTVP